MSLVSELNSVADDLKTCYDNLKNILVSKYVEFSSSDKLLDLINKIGELKIQTSIPIAGTDNLLYQYSDEVTNTTTSEKLMCEYLHEGSDGTLKLSISLRGIANYYNYAVIRITRNGNKTIYTTLENTKNTYTNYSCNIDVLKDDKISVHIKSGTNGYAGDAKNLKITCDYLII